MIIQAASAQFLAPSFTRQLPTRQSLATSSANVADTVSISKASREALVASKVSSASSSVDASAKEIMSRYNVRNISYTDLVKMAGELRESGSLPENDYLDFIGPSPEFASITEDRNPYWNAPQDYIAKHEQHVAFMQATGSEQRFIDFEKHVLSLFNMFYSLQESK